MGQAAGGAADDAVLGAMYAESASDGMQALTLRQALVSAKTFSAAPRAIAFPFLPGGEVTAYNGKPFTPATIDYHDATRRHDVRRGPHPLPSRIYEYAEDPVSIYNIPLQAIAAGSSNFPVLTGVTASAEELHFSFTAPVALHFGVAFWSTARDRGICRCDGCRPRGCRRDVRSARRKIDADGPLRSVLRGDVRVRALVGVAARARAGERAEIVADRLIDRESDQERDEFDRHEVAHRIDECGLEKHGGGHDEHDADRQCDDAGKERARVSERSDGRTRDVDRRARAPRSIRRRRGSRERSRPRCEGMRPRAWLDRRDLVGPTGDLAERRGFRNFEAEHRCTSCARG